MLIDQLQSSIALGNCLIKHKLPAAKSSYGDRIRSGKVSGEAKRGAGGGGRIIGAQCVIRCKLKLVSAAREMWANVTKVTRFHWKIFHRRF